MHKIAVGKELTSLRKALTNIKRSARNDTNGRGDVPSLMRENRRRIRGVAAAELRIVRPVLLDIEGMAEPATGMAVSVPDFAEPAVNRLYLRKGRLPEAGRDDEVAVVETFADAHKFTPGDRFKAVMNGRKRDG